MIRFEEHDGMIFRMLEEPVPLTTDTKLPCLVRLIQDDSRMGMFNRDTKPSRLSDFYLAARIVNNNIIVDEFMESDYHRFEIIGYPVDEGSAEWALWAMMEGEKVTKKHLSHVYWHYDASPHLKCISEYNCGTLQIMVVPEIWLTTAEPTGWQLYEEPEPKPAKEQFEVGDWVETNKQHHVEITEFPAKHYNIESKVYECYNLSSNKRHLIEEREIVRKLSPSEVIVKIGCLGGTVRCCDNEFICPESTPDNPCHFVLQDQITGFWSIIYFKMLDTPTRELVQSLLKAQEEEK